jgi:hypothetical protein
MHIINYSIGFGVATVVGLCIVAPVSAAPVLTNTAAVKAAAGNSITEVRYIGRGWARRAVGVGVGLAVAGAVARTAASYAYGYPSYGYGYPSYGYGYPSGYGYAGYNTGYYGYAPSSYNYGYGGYGYNYGYTPGYYGGYGVRPVARAVVRRAYFRRR